MDIKEVFEHRRSVRKFKDKAIEDEVISEILCAANTTPCTDTCNYYFGVIKDPIVKTKSEKLLSMRIGLQKRRLFSSAAQI